MFSEKDKYGLSPHLRAQELLRERIAGQWTAGHKLPTTGELANEYGVSIPTLRKALGVLVDEGLLEVQKNRGYFVSEGLSKVGPIALLYDLDLGGSRMANSALLDILECKSALEAIGLSVRVYLGRKPDGEKSDRLDAKELLQDIMKGEVAGVINMSGRVSMDLSQATRETGIPHIGLGRYYAQGIDHAFEPFFRRALRIVRAHDRKKVAFGAMRYLYPELAGDSLTVLRLLEEQGFYHRREWIREDWHQSLSGAGWATFRAIWGAAQEKPDVLIVGSPTFALDIRQGMTEAGIRFPEDLLVITARTKGDPLLSHLPWPSVEVNMTIRGKALAQMMYDCLHTEGYIPGKIDVDAWEINDPLLPEEAYESMESSKIDETVPAGSLTGNKNA